MNDTDRALPIAPASTPSFADRAGIAPDAAWEAATEQWTATREAPARLAAILTPADAPAFDPLPAGSKA